MELPVLLLTNGVLLPEAKMKIPIRSKTNLAMLDRFVLAKSSTAKTMILVAYREEKDKSVFPIATVAVVEQVVRWQYNANVQYTLHLLGVSRAKIEKFAVPFCEVKQLYDTPGDLSKELEVSFLSNCKKLITFLTREDIDAAHSLQLLVKDQKLENLSDYVISQIHSIPYPNRLNFLATLDISKRVEFANGELEKMFKASRLLDAFRLSYC